jgi:shikimate dehydrogenase
VPPLPGGNEQLESLLVKMRAGEIDGLNVTIPHKVSLLPKMDVLTEAARDIGALNTILRREGALVGDNTDAAGFQSDLERCLPPGLDAGRALVLGAGGAARAVVYALMKEGWRVLVAARRLDQASELADHFQELAASSTGIVEAKSLAELGSREFHRRLNVQEGDFFLVVNATPVGMEPFVESSPWPERLPWPRIGLAYDLVYNPLETVFMKRARLAGLQAASGLGMLVEQAALAFEGWTGISAPRDVMREAALKEGLGG